MRFVVLGVALLSTSLAKFCDSAEAPSTAPQAEAPAAPAAEAKAGAEAKAEVKASAKAQMGGSVVAIADHQLELRLFQNGAAEAWLFDAKGQAAPASAGAKLSLTAQGTGDAKVPIELAWDAERARFAADAKADVALTPAPVDISLTLDGKAHTAKLERYALLAAPELGGAVVVAGDHSGELLVDADGNAQLLIRDAQAQKIEGELEGDVKLTLAGAAAPITLKLNPAKAVFEGKASAELRPGPIELQIQADTGRLAEFAFAAQAQHGGKLVVAGGFSAELVADGGFVSAFVMDASGKAHAKGDLDLKLRGGAGQILALTWHAPSASYRAKLDGKLDLNAAPLQLLLKADGKLAVGLVPSLALDAKAGADAKLQAKAGADVKAKADLNAKANAAAKAAADAKLAANAKLKAPEVKASAKVAAPKVNVTPPKVNTSGAAKTGASGSAKAGFSFGTK